MPPGSSSHPFTHLSLIIRFIHFLKNSCWLNIFIADRWCRPARQVTQLSIHPFILFSIGLTWRALLLQYQVNFLLKLSNFPKSSSKSRYFSKSRKSNNICFPGTGTTVFPLPGTFPWSAGVRGSPLSSLSMMSSWTISLSKTTSEM